ncbi:MAG: hypothetical protein ACI9CB_000049 [Rhodothermales bacterium]
MNSNKFTLPEYLTLALLGAMFLLPVTSLAQAPIVHPGAPGEPSRTLTADEATEIAVTSYSPADIIFLRDMIPHHHQAMEMAALVADRTNRPELVDVAGRINSSQADEIEFMQSWLSERGEEVPDPTVHDSMHTTLSMAGMASPEQMVELAGASAIDFDRLFLSLMIRHHDGAVKMVKELLEQPGAAYDPVLFEFTSDITNDQTAEIERMNTLLVGLSDDPRAGLKAGFEDAEQVMLNMELVVSMQRPPGFFDPVNPLERESKPLPKKEVAQDPAIAVEEPLGEVVEVPSEEEESDGDQDGRSPMLSFVNTDMAFRDDILVAGSYHGFNVYQLQEGGVPKHMASIVCPGGQGDVSIVGNLLFMSAQETRGRLDCGLEGVIEDVSAERFRGLRIFDIADLTRPVQVGAVQTCRGSHTHSVVSGPDENGKIIVYNSGTSSVREEEEMPGCFDESPGDDRTALFRIDIIEIPVADPGSARIIDSPAVFADPETGVMAGLWHGGDHGDETQETSQTNQCHDITVFPELNIAAGACAGNGIIFDISDPRKPYRIDAAADSGFAYWHSATFNNDGSKVLFTDEWGGGGRPRCRAHDPLTWGADAFYDIIDGKLEFRGYFKMPAPQVEEENCVAHNGSIIPVPGRDIFAQAWYQGGISIIDFTDSRNPTEIGYFDRGPMDAEDLVFGGYWSVYWYDGYLYGTETVRGIDVLKLLPSEFLTENEIKAATLADQGRRFNPQQQFRVTWPAEPVVARAYVDQLLAANAVPAALAANINKGLDESESRLSQGNGGKRLARKLKSVAADLKNLDVDPVSAKRISGLAATLTGIAARLRE